MGVLGGSGHGKTTLTAAIVKWLSLQGGAQRVDAEQLDRGNTEKIDGVTACIARVEYETKKRHYTYADWPTHADCMKRRIYNTSATGEERSGLIGDKPLQWCLRTTK